MQKKVLCGLTRREVLRFFMIALPATAIGWKPIDYFDRELVCVHVYDPISEMPPPLLESTDATIRRPADLSLFHAGLPELILCQTHTGLLNLYPYFWPVARNEVKQLQGKVQVLHQARTVTGNNDIVALRKKIPEERLTGKATNRSLAVIFTLNDATRAVCAAVVNCCRSMQVDELIIFKDPSRPPYLCSYASRQKGFKRPPPIG